MKTKKNECLPFFIRKEEYWFTHLSVKERKRWFYDNYPAFRSKIRLRLIIKRLKGLSLPLRLSFIRWVLIDFLRGKSRKFFGIYQFVALPGEGKTMSMVAHMQRAKKENPELFIACNFKYKYADAYISHWLDIINFAVIAKLQKRPCIIAVDEIHVTFDSSDWQSFPAELLALLSFNRKYRLQFLCTAQIYDRIPKKIRDIANYTVICKNVWGVDRLFKCFYFSKADYESRFEGKKKKAQFLREFVADDDFYRLYDTDEQIDQMKSKAKEEMDKKLEAFEILFGSQSAEGTS